MQKYKFEIWLLKSTILDHQKSAFLVFEENSRKIFFFVFLLWFSFKNNRRTNVLLVAIFENAKKSYWPSKTPFWLFLGVNNGFCEFSKILIKITVLCLLFLKLKQKKIMKHSFTVFLFKNSKMTFFNLFLNFFWTTFDALRYAFCS